VNAIQNWIGKCMNWHRRMTNASGLETKKQTHISLVVGLINKTPDQAQDETDVNYQCLTTSNLK